MGHGSSGAMVTKEIISNPRVVQLIGHMDTKTTGVYLQVIREEKRQMVTDGWEG